MSKEITLKSYALEKPSDMMQMANVLKDHIVKNKLYTDIVGKKYVNVEGWAFAGFLTGVIPKVEEVTNMSNDKEVKWMVKVNLYQGDKVVGIGIAICSNKESKKKTFDEYAVLSMAQTRAIGKAYRNLMGWVIKLAGYESTPSEEMSTEKPQTKQDAYQVAKSMIEGATTQKRLMSLLERVEKSDKLTEEQRKELNELISRKVDALETQEEQKKK